MSTSAVSSVLHYSESSPHDVTKAGTCIYWVDATNFYEWEFRTRLKVSGLAEKEDKLQEATMKIVEGLRGSAFVVHKK